MRSSALTILLVTLSSLPAGCGAEPLDDSDPVALSLAPLSVEPLSVEPLSVEPLSVEPLSVEPLSVEPLSVEPLSGAAADSSAELAVWAATVDIVVRHGETLVVLADQSACTSEDLALLNGFDVTHMLLGGETIRVPVDRVDLDTLQARRESGLQGRLGRYLSGRGGVAGVSTHRVRTGETGWSIARDVVSAPMWVVAAYNPDVDLDHLRIGDSLAVPVMADMVAEADRIEVFGKVLGEVSRD